MNDAGKSTTLATLALLLGGDGARAGEVCGVLLEADADEADELATRAINGVLEDGARFEVAAGRQS